VTARKRDATSLKRNRFNLESITALGF